MGATGIFGAADLIVFIVCSLLSLFIGISVVLFGGTQVSTWDYFLGGRRQRLVPVVISLVVSFHSSILILGVPAEAYLYGPMFAIRVFGLFAVTPIATRAVVPLFHRLKLTSIFKYFERRFTTMTVRFLMVFAAALFNTIYSGMVLVGPAMVIRPLIGVPDWVIIIVTASVAVAYTSIGGIKAVIWTDVFQCLVMTAGLLAVLIQCTMNVGGPSNVIEIAKEYNRLEVFDFNPDPTIRHTFWTLNIGSFFVNLMVPFSQQTLQRMNSIETVRQARHAFCIYMPLYYVFELLAVACGIAIFAFNAHQRCDPLAAGIISNPNEILVRSLHDLFKHIPGLTGLFMAALLSASLSTVSSCLNGLAAMFCEDVLKVKWNGISERKATAISKVSVLATGFVSTCFALILRYARGNLNQMFGSILGSFSGPSVGIFVLSIFFKRTTTLGAVIGGVLGFIFSMWLLIGFNFSSTLPQTPWLPLGPTDGCPVSTSEDMLRSNTTRFYQSGFATMNSTTVGPPVTPSSEDIGPEGLDRLYSLSYMYFGVLTTLLTITVGICVSFVSYPTSHPRVDPDNVVSFKDMHCLSPDSFKCVRCLRRPKADESITQDNPGETELHEQQISLM